MSSSRPETPCGACGGPRERLNQSRCRRCHAAYMRARRTKPEVIRKDIARRTAMAAKKRGSLVRIPCQRCGSPDSEVHHPDYGKPTQIVWLCEPCHKSWHVFLHATNAAAWTSWLTNELPKYPEIIRGPSVYAGVTRPGTARSRAIKSLRNILNEVRAA